MNQAERRVWLIKALLDERPDGAVLLYLPEPASSAICFEPL